MLFGGAGTAEFETPQAPETLAIWGTMNITFNSCSSASATLSGIDGTIDTELMQLLANENVDCELIPAPVEEEPTAANQPALSISTNSNFGQKPRLKQVSGTA